MFEFLISASLTILPDYLFRHYYQGKRWGHELTLYSVWFELRWGITGCALMTLTLITMVFYFHPGSTNVSSFFRTVTILPVTPGRVDEVYVENNQLVKAGDPIFRIEADRQETALATAEARITEIEAQLVLAQADLQSASAQVAQVQAIKNERELELARTESLMARGSSAVSQQELDRQRAQVASQTAALEAAMSQENGARAKVENLLPAQLASAQAAREQAQVELDLTTVYASVEGRIEQFALQPGDYVSSVLRPAGILVPTSLTHKRVQAGYNQISAQVIKPGMVAEITCASKPLTVIPMVVVEVQDVIASGAVAPSDRLVDVSANRMPGSLLVYMEPLYEGGLDGLIPGSACISNVYTNNHDRLENEDLSTPHRVALHVIDTVGLVHAFMLRFQSLLLPMRTLVLTGGH